MTFSVESQKRAIKRNALIKIQGKFNLTTRLTNTATNTYTAIFKLPVKNVVQPGGSPSVSQTNDVVTITTTTTPSSTNPVIVTYILYIARNYTRQPDPELGGSNLVWLPRLVNDVSYNESIKNITDGLLTLSSTNIVLNNADGFFNDLTNQNNNILGQPVRVWFQSESVASLVSVFKGDGALVQAAENSVSIGVRSILNKLQQSPRFGDVDNELFFSSSTPGVTGIPYNRDIGKPIPFYFGTSTKWQGGSPGVAPPHEELPEAYCADYIGVTGGTFSRKWLLGRVSQYQPFGTPHTITSKTATTATIATANIKQYQTGYIAFFRDSGGALITDSGTVLGRTVNEVNYTTNTMTFNSVPANAVTVEPQRIILSFKALDGSDRFVTPWSFDSASGSPDRHNTVVLSSVATSGGNLLVYATLADNEESAFITPAVSPRFYECRFHWVIGTETNHSTFIKKLVEDVGTITNASSFTTASTTNVSINTRIPDYGETVIKPVEDIVGAAAKSALGFLTSDASGVMFYNILQNNTTPIRTLTESDIIANSFSSEPLLRDVAQSVQFVNTNQSPDFQAIYTNFLQTTTSAAFSNLLGIKKIEEFKHVAEDFRTRKNQIVNYFTNIRVRYSFDVQIKHFDLKVGDVVQLNHRNLSIPTNVRIIETKKQPQFISLTCEAFTI